MLTLKQQILQNKKMMEEYKAPKKLSSSTTEAKSIFYVSQMFLMTPCEQRYQGKRKLTDSSKTKMCLILQRIKLEHK